MYISLLKADLYSLRVISALPLFLALCAAALYSACPKAGGAPQTANPSHSGSRDYPLPLIPPAKLLPVILHSSSGYTLPEHSYKHKLRITAEAIFLDLRQAKESCRHKILLNRRQKRLVWQALMGIGFCRRESRFEVRASDLPVNTISVGEGAKKRDYPRHPRGMGNYSYLCKGGPLLYRNLKKILTAQELQSCPDFQPLLR